MCLTIRLTVLIDSAYVFIGGLHFDLTEGDVITIFSQYDLRYILALLY